MLILPNNQDVTDTPDPDDGESLAAVWSRLARRCSDGQLAACAALMPATVVAAAVLAALSRRWLTAWWPLTALPLFVSAFGVWGIADREQRADAPSSPVWEFVQLLAGALATVSAIIATLWFFKRVVGTWIS